MILEFKRKEKDKKKNQTKVKPNKLLQQIEKARIGVN